MNNLFYHASNTGRLKELLPLSAMRGSNERVCYVTPVRAYALFYLRDMEINHVTCSVTDQGVTIYHEQFPNQLQRMYQGRSGYLYTCENNRNIILAHTGGVWASTQPLTVSSEETISDVYAQILKAEQSGEVQVISYDSQSHQKKAEITDMIKNAILRQGYLLSNSPKTRFYCEVFPEAWEAAQRSSNL